MPTVGNRSGTALLRPAAPVVPRSPRPGELGIQPAQGGPDRGRLGHALLRAGLRRDRPAAPGAPHLVPGGRRPAGAARGALVADADAPDRSRGAARGRAAGRGAAAGGGGRERALRPRPRPALASPSPGHRRPRARPAPHPAPRGLGRLVDRSSGPRAGRPPPGLLPGRAVVAPGAPDPVFRLRRLGARVADRRGAGVEDRLLAPQARRRAGPRATSGPPARHGRRRGRRPAELHPRPRDQHGPQSPRPHRGRHPLHAPGGGLLGALVALLRPGRRLRRDPGRAPHAHRARATDRLLRQHGRPAHRPLGRAAVPRRPGARPRDRPRSPGPPGGAVREAGREPGAGARPRSHAALPGHVLPARRPRRGGRAAGPAPGADRGREPHREVRPDPRHDRARRALRGLRRVPDRAVRRDHRRALDRPLGKPPRRHRGRSVGAGVRALPPDAGGAPPARRVAGRAGAGARNDGGGLGRGAGRRDAGRRRGRLGGRLRHLRRAVRRREPRRGAPHGPRRRARGAGRDVPRAVAGGGRRPPRHPARGRRVRAPRPGAPRATAAPRDRRLGGGRRPGRRRPRRPPATGAEGPPDRRRPGAAGSRRSRRAGGGGAGESRLRCLHLGLHRRAEGRRRVARRRRRALPGGDLRLRASARRPGPAVRRLQLRRRDRAGDDDPGGRRHSRAQEIRAAATG